MSFLGEIGRRKVFRVAAVYAVVAWLIIQVVGEVSEPLNLPGWLDTTVIVLLAIGFPLVLILGWIFELTPAGVRRDEGEHERGSTPAAAPVFTYVVQGLVLVAVSFLLVDQFLLDDGSQPAASAVASEGEAGNVVRFRVPIADDAARFLGGEDDARFGWPASTSVALSNDGRLLVFSAWETDSEGQVSSRLYLRRLDREGAVAIAGSDGASAPFFAPDDANVGFFAGAALKRVSLANDRVETLVADAGLLGTAGVRGASWGPDGTIVYGGARGIYRVSANGGTPELLVDIGAAARLDLAQPLLLPGGRWLLFHAIADSYDPELAAIQVKDVVTGDERTLLTNAMNPVYLEATGHLLFMRVGALVAARFDADRAELVGEPVVVLEDVIQAVGMPNGGWDTGAAQLAVSRSGNIAYAGGGIYREAEGSSMLMRINLDGTVEPLLAGELNFNRVRVSPDG
ncbi:MAG TPA: hypothetical protein VIV14_13460, partial [Gammaproteobacteria bacterium]